MYVQEASRIGTAIHRNTIPQEYKKYPIIGQGTTSIVLEKDPDTVIVLTRDAQKKDWLTYGIEGLDVNWKDTIDIRHPKSSALGEMPVYVIEMPKLMKLDAVVKRRLKTEIRQWDSLWQKYLNKSKGKMNQRDMMDFIREYQSTYPDGMFNSLLNHLGNYDISQFIPDLHSGNFMMDSGGNIVMIDPIVDREIYDIVMKMKEKKRPSYW